MVKKNLKINFLTLHYMSFYSKTVTFMFFVSQNYEISYELQ